MSGGIGPCVKNWCFTSYSENEPEFDPYLMAYTIYGHETCPTSDRLHWQGFISFKNRKRLAACKKVAPGAHFECLRGTVQENIYYCSKDNQFKEFGTRLVITA